MALPRGVSAGGDAETETGVPGEQVAIDRLAWMRPFLLERDEFLDAGAGGGELVYFLPANGIRAQGVEPNVEFAEFASRELGLPIEAAFLEDAAHPAGRTPLPRGPQYRELLPASGPAVPSGAFIQLQSGYAAADGESGWIPCGGVRDFAGWRKRVACGTGGGRRA